MGTAGQSEVMRGCVTAQIIIENQSRTAVRLIADVFVTQLYALVETTTAAAVPRSMIGTMLLLLLMLLLTAIDAIPHLSSPTDAIASKTPTSRHEISIQ